MKLEILNCCLGSLTLLAPLALGDATMTDDRAQIEICLRHYFRAGDESSSRELRQAFHPTTIMFWAAPDGALMGLSQPAWWARLDAAQAPQPALARHIEGIEVAGDSAAAKVRSDYPGFQFTDFISLLRVGGRWQMVGKVFHRREPADAPLPSAEATRSERAAIEALLDERATAIHARDAQRFGGAYHPRAMTYVLHEGQLAALSFPELQARLPSGAVADERKSVLGLDVAVNVAQARLERGEGAARRMEIASLVKVAGSWKIVGAIEAQQS